MGNGVPQTSFTSGEIAPSLYGRFDYARYYTGAKTILNFIVQQYGGLINRSGTYLTTEVKDSTKRGYLIPFEFSSSQSYVLEFGNQVMRIIKDGGIVVWPSGPSTGLPVEVVTPYLEIDLPLLKFTQSADVMTLTHPAYKTKELSRLDHHLWTLADMVTVEGPFQDINVDSSIKVSASAVTGNITLTASTGIFTANHVGMLFYLEQSPDGLTRRWEVQKDVVTNDIRRAGVNYYQAQAGGTTGTVRPTTLEGMEYDGDPGVPWLYLHSGFGVVQITGFTSATVVSATVLKRLPEGVVTGTVGHTIQGVTAGVDPIPPIGEDPGSPGTPVIINANAHGGVSGQSFTIAGVGAGFDGVWQVDVIDVNHFALSACFANPSSYVSGGTASLTLSNPPSYKWAFCAWGAPFGYPGSCGYTQERQVFGGSANAPHTFWMSRSQGYKDFGRSNPILDDDSITYRMNSKKLIEIRHFVELSEFIILTSDGPYMIRGGTDGVIKPGGISRKKQSANGVSHVPPILLNSEALYIQEKGSQVRSLGYSFQSDAFVGQDLTVVSNHLFKGRTIVDWAYQAVPFSCVWVVLDNGILLTLTYMPDQTVVGWSKHNTDGFYESCSCITENNQDVVYFQVRRTINGQTKRFIEKMAPRLYTDPKEAFFVDCGLTYRGAPATHISGLDHLEGKEVSILIDGNVHQRRTVAGGAITLDRPGSVVHVGLPYVSDLETLEIANAQSDIRDKKKIINHVSLIVDQSRGIWSGPDADNLIEAKRTAFKTYNDTSLETTGLLDLRIPARWEKAGRVFCRQSEPLPLCILTVIPEVTSGGS